MDAPSLGIGLHDRQGSRHGGRRPTERKAHPFVDERRPCRRRDARAAEDVNIVGCGVRLNEGTDERRHREGNIDEL